MSYENSLAPIGGDGQYQKGQQTDLPIYEFEWEWKEKRPRRQAKSNK